MQNCCAAKILANKKENCPRAALLPKADTMRLKAQSPELEKKNKSNTSWSHPRNLQLAELQSCRKPKFSKKMSMHQAKSRNQIVLTAGGGGAAQSSAGALPRLHLPFYGNIYCNLSEPTRGHEGTRLFPGYEE